MGLSESEKSFEWVDVDKLKHHPDNPRRGNIEAIRESIRAHGVTRPIVVSRKTLHVLAGNHTLKAAKAENLARIPVVFLDGLTRVQERKILLADNRTSDLGDYDNEALAQLLQEVKDEAGLLGTAYDEAALDALLEGLTPADADEWGDAFNAVPDGDKPPFQAMTFTLHDSQADTVERAIAAAKPHASATVNENSNGNALHYVCEMFLRRTP